MFRVIALILVIGVSSLACQQYSTTIQEGVTRVDETAIIGALRSIGAAEQAYSLANGGKFGTLEQLVQGGFIDQRFTASPVKDYVLKLNIGPSSDAGGFFSCNADPANEKVGRHFYIDSTSNQIHVNATQPATANDQTLQ